MNLTGHAAGQGLYPVGGKLCFMTEICNTGFQLRNLDVVSQLGSKMTAGYYLHIVEDEKCHYCKYR